MMEARNTTELEPTAHHQMKGVSIGEVEVLTAPVVKESRVTATTTSELIAQALALIAPVMRGKDTETRIALIVQAVGIDTDTMVVILIVLVMRRGIELKEDLTIPTVVTEDTGEDPAVALMRGDTGTREVLIVQTRDTEPGMDQAVLRRVGNAGSTANKVSTLHTIMSCVLQN